MRRVITSASVVGLAAGLGLWVRLVGAVWAWLCASKRALAHAKGRALQNVTDAVLHVVVRDTRM